jgi:hypothetical protein
MNIGSKNGYPSSALSNFAPHPFTVSWRGFTVECNSMEGFLQSLKFKNPEMQKEICTLVGYKAKMKGKHKNWYRTQTLWWNGESIDRHLNEYQELLDVAYDALSKNASFRKALLITNGILTHSIGNTDSHSTILTRREFCGRLMKIRYKLSTENKFI